MRSEVPSNRLYPDLPVKKQADEQDRAKVL
jgi:hypothetical protein